MTFDQVLVFHKIIQTGSFKSAASELHKTQPAISLAIKKLEEELEVELFDRTGYRPELTVHGKAFYEKSLKVLHSMHELEGMSQSFRNEEEPEITIAVDGIAPLPGLLHLFKKLGVRYPNTKLNLQFNILSGAEEMVLAREADMGIAHFVSDYSSQEVVPFTSVKMIPVMSRELYEEKKITSQSDLSEIDQIIVGDRRGGKGPSFGVLDHGRKWRLKDNNFKKELIVSGLGWGHMPEHSIEREIQEKKLVILNFEDIHPRELAINLIRHKRHQLGVVAKIFWDELVSAKKEK